MQRHQKFCKKGNEDSSNNDEEESEYEEKVDENVATCQECEMSFASAAGLAVHYQHCNKKLVFNLVSALILFFIFLYFSFNSWNKFRDKRISTEVLEKEIIDMVYPSITVCPEKTLKLTELPSIDRNLENARDIWKNSIRKELYVLMNC